MLYLPSAAHKSCHHFTHFCVSKCLTTLQVSSTPKELNPHAILSSDHFFTLCNFSFLWRFLIHRNITKHSSNLDRKQFATVPHLQGLSFQTHNYPVSNHL